ncbi:LLM class flavin-dependent oxidoreductase [Microbacterium betulae]|uniref:LLM class flavin-dependent oxidoreductase n=1 Tax=Microbacterium betulae TaxID=2981139 RepID=A0AA97I514_9MICO|nr:LLM class flavin-dependent oxidoreductase [Microbacterium sp. AB]WOF23191.1 LLM class flavin-dependent oxidoreductase [Microbacterium sp. AB]
MTGVVTAAGLVIAGNHPEDDPAAGLAETLRVFSFAEGLGYDVAGVRQRHLERGVSSALPFLAAASQRTTRIALETDVVPLGYENPFRLAEDFATVDALSGGRVHVGVSSSAPHAGLLAPLTRPDIDTATDPYALIGRFLTALEGRPLADEPIATPYGPQIPRIQPHVPGLRERVWLGGGSIRSVRWAAERGLHLLLGNVGDGEVADDFEAAQHIHVELYRSAFAGADAPRIGVERVILPTDSATAAQRAHYADYAASREERTRRPVSHGTRKVVFQRDLHGTSDEIVERLAHDPTFAAGAELRVALPYAFAEDEYRQILSDVRHAVLPRLGWSPGGAAGAASGAAPDARRPAGTTSVA